MTNEKPEPEPETEIKEEIAYALRTREMFLVLFSKYIEWEWRGKPRRDTSSKLAH